MYQFIDEFDLQVELHFTEGPFEIEPKHVLVVVYRNDQFLCTIHKKRGIEFPGGKVELGETLEQAAYREVLEETGVHILDIKLVGYYIVRDSPAFCKVIFVAQVEQEEVFTEELETSGRVWLTEQQLWQQPNLSFYMRDAGMKRIVQEVKRYEG